MVWGTKLGMVSLWISASRTQRRPTLSFAPMRSRRLLIGSASTTLKLRKPNCAGDQAGFSILYVKYVNVGVENKHVQSCVIVLARSEKGFLNLFNGLTRGEFTTIFVIFKGIYLIFKSKIQWYVTYVFFCLLTHKERIAGINSVSNNISLRGTYQAGRSWFWLSLSLSPCPPAQPATLAAKSWFTRILRFVQPCQLVPRFPMNIPPWWNPPTMKNRLKTTIIYNSYNGSISNNSIWMLNVEASF